MLDSCSPWNRDHIFKNQKGGTNFFIKKCFPKRYHEAVKILDGMAFTLREVNMKAVHTELVLQGTTLCLLYKNKKRDGNPPSDWIKYHKVDPTLEQESETMQKEKIREKGTSILVSMFQDTTSPEIYKTTVINYVGDAHKEL